MSTASWRGQWARTVPVAAAATVADAVQHHSLHHCRSPLDGATNVWLLAGRYRTLEIYRPHPIKERK